VVYDALIALGPRARAVFVDGLRSPVESVRVSSCFGVVAKVEPATARSLLVPLLGDEAASVRAGAAESLALVGGDDIPDELASAVRDPAPAVRTAAAGALGSFDDPRSVDGALDALLGPDHDAADRAGESLVRLTRGPVARPAAEEALHRTQEEWPVEQALTLARLGAL
jgi:HEAT repeat protein